MLYVAEVWRPEGNLGHQYERIGAWAEWVIYQAEKNKYRLTEDSGYSAADVEEYALVVSRRFGRSYRFDDLSLESLHDAIKHLVKATQEDKYEPDIHRRRYFSDALYRLLSQYEKKA